MYDKLFEHCHMDNPVFVQGMFWIIVFLVGYACTLYYKWQEANEAQEEENKKVMEKYAEALARQEARKPMIQQLARPIEKKVEIPILEVTPDVAVEVPAEKSNKKKQQPVQMMEQTSSVDQGARKAAASEDHRQSTDGDATG